MGVLDEAQKETASGQNGFATTAVDFLKGLISIKEAAEPLVVKKSQPINKNSGPPVATQNGSAQNNPASLMGFDINKIMLIGLGLVVAFVVVKKLRK
jgi:hypothetical protein